MQLKKSVYLRLHISFLINPESQAANWLAFKDHELPPKGIFIQYYLKEMLDAATVYRFIFNKLFALLH